MRKSSVFIGAIVLAVSVQATTYYVSASRPDDSGIGTSWTTAKKTIQAAINISASNDTIVVTNGIYASIITSNTTVTIQSINGAADTIIDGGTSNRCATLGTDTNIVLKGFTLQNGHATGRRVEEEDKYGGGAKYGTLHNCTLINNTADYAGGGAYMSALNNCILVGNSATNFGGGALFCTLNNCIISANYSQNGGGTASCTLNNCTIVGNSSASWGGGAYGGEVNNSIVWGNTVLSGAYTNYYGLTFHNSCTTPIPTSGTGDGGGNICSDPLFMDAINGDLRIREGSPCINAGTNELVVGAFDLAGNPRIIGMLVDMGAYEADYIPYTVTFSSQGGSTPAPPSITATNSFAYGPLASTTKAGYIFGGWYTNTACTGTAITVTTTVSLTSAHTLYAKWTLDPYYVAGGANATPIGITSAVNSDAAHSGDGLNSLKLGGIGQLADGQMAGIEWSATGPGILAFAWKVSSEADYDWLRFCEAGSGPTNQISGNVDWSRRSITVLGATDLPHTFRWEYQKDPAGDYVGQDCGWVDAISWIPLYTVTVNSGSGDGYYTNNAYASIIATAAATHYEFDRWIGDTNTVVNIFAASTTLLMPNTNAIVTATYKPILYTLSASNASGGGTYSYASTVEIRASAFANKRFYRWTGDVGSVADVNAATTTVVTSDHTISLTATYSVPLTVNSGTGSGWYPEGSVASIAAAADPMWKEFAVWTVDAGLLSNANARTTTLALPTGPATVTATYKDSVARLTGSYGRTYSESGTVGAITPDAGAGSPSGTPAVKLGGSGVIPDNGFAAFETVVSGSGSTLFSWKVSSESNGDYLKFKVDGGEVAAISGTKGPWTQVSNRVNTAGSHTLRWEYVKNGSIASSTDAGWVDDIVWLGDIEAPTLTPSIIAMAVTNNFIELGFTGERGISYILQTNATLNASGWGYWHHLFPIYVYETNGVHRYKFNPIMGGSDKMFYRVLDTSLTNLLSGLLAYYPFNGNANDESGNEHNGTVYGGGSYTTNRFGQVNGSFAFDGTKYIDTGFVTNPPVSVSLWVYVPLAGFPKDSTPFGTFGDNILTYDDFIFQCTTNNILKFRAFGGNYATANPVSGGQWVHVVCILQINPTPIHRIYVNGQAFEGAYEGTLPNTLYSYLIGAINNGGGAPWGLYRGALDDVRIYNRVLSATEVLQLQHLTF